MNWIIRLGQWFGARKSAKVTDLAILFETMLAQEKRIDAQIAELKNSQTLPQQVAKEFALLNVRLNLIELYIGLKREPKAEHVAGAPKIS